MPVVVLKKIGEELQDNIHEYDEYYDSGNDYFNEEFLGDDENSEY